MPQLLLELFSEEIPARMQAQAARDLERMARERLAEAGFLPEGVKAFAGPRRLTLAVDGLAPAQSDRAEERKGPRTNAPGQAIDGFLRCTGPARILHAARTLGQARNLELVEDEGLLDEVAGLAEWPTPILGDMDPAFLDLPPEVIRTSMRTHQKYFAVRDPATGKLAPHFLTVA